MAVDPTRYVPHSHYIRQRANTRFEPCTDMWTLSVVKLQVTTGAVIMPI